MQKKHKNMLQHHSMSGIINIEIRQGALWI